MLLFIIAINPLLRELEDLYKDKGEIIAYADDILIVGKSNFLDSDVQQIAAKVKQYGLEVNVEKCKRIDVHADDQLLFAGIPLSTNGRVNRV